MNKNDIYTELDRLFALRDAVLNHYDEITENIDNLTEEQKAQISIFKKLKTIYTYGKGEYGR